MTIQRHFINKAGVKMITGTITRRLETFKNDYFKELLTKNDFVNKIKKLKSVNSSQRPTICAELCEMFKKCGIECEAGETDNYYENLYLNNKKEIKSFADVEKKILKLMFSKFEGYPTPEEYMLRMVNRLCNPEDKWQSDTLRLRILKQFIKYGNCLQYELEIKDENGKKKKKVSVYGGKNYIKSYVKEKIKKAPKDTEEIIDNVDDDIFRILETANKDQKKQEGKYGIIKLADDLATGKFKASGATKRDLYMFAIVYDMTYYYKSEKEPEMIIDYDSDIEKNLFEDYYANNLMRFITDTYSGNQGSFELDPSGQGINYKNFAEVVYLYFISKDYDPREKIRLSNEMIERLKTTGSENNNSELKNAVTGYYVSIFNQKLLEMSETEFEKYVAENYDCNTECEITDKNTIIKKGVMQINTSQRTAYKAYCELIESLEIMDKSVENCNYGLWFTDVSAIKKYGNEKIKKILEKEKTEEEQQKIEKFIKLLFGINMFLGCDFEEEKSEMNTNQEHNDPSKRLIRAMSVKKAEDVTRTSMIVAYYYYYNTINEKRESRKSFMEVYNDYTNPITGINALLEEARFQKISERNIFDIAVMFSSYAYLK